MIIINKKERDYLVSKGFWFGENGLSKTYSKRPTYYISEHSKIKNCLMEYRKSKGYA